MLVCVRPTCLFVNRLSVRQLMQSCCGCQAGVWVNLIELRQSVQDVVQGSGSGQ
jgi:hypothetical protein